MILKRNQCRMPLTVIAVGSAFAFLCVVAAIVYAAVQGYIGFGMTDSSALSCSNYLALKTEWNRSLLYSTAFVGYSAAALFLASAAALSALLCWANRSETREEFPEFTFAKLCALYLLLSLAAMGLVPGVGFHLTFMVEKGANCTGKYSVNWIIFVVLLGTALLMTLVAWIFLFILTTLIKDQVVKSETKQDIKIPQQKQQKDDKDSPMKDYLNFLLIQNKLNNNNYQTPQIKQPLLEEIDSQDKASQQNDIDRIVFVGYSQYKHKQELLQQKQQEEQKKVQQYLLQQAILRQQQQRLQQEEQKRQKEKKNKLSNLVLSPDDPNFELMMLEQSEQMPVVDNVNKQPQIGERSQTLGFFQNPSVKEGKQSQKNKNALQQYPANYVPINEQDQKKYKAYKKKILKLLNSNNKKSVRHPQNIEGGRSKRLISKYLQQSKRPVRNEQLYLLSPTNIIRDQQLPKENTVVLEVSQEDSFDKSSNLTPKAVQEKDSPKQQDEQIKTPQIEPFFNDNRRQQQMFQKIHFSKEKTKSPLRKQLFEQNNSYFKQWDSSSILGKIYSGVVQSGPKARLKSIRSQKDDSKTPKRTKQQIIQSIRYKVAF